MSVSVGCGHVPHVDNELEILSITKSGNRHYPVRVKFLAGGIHYVFDCGKWALTSFAVFQRVVQANVGVTVNSAYSWHGRRAENKMFREELLEAMQKGGVK